MIYSVERWSKGGGVSKTVLFSDVAYTYFPVLFLIPVLLYNFRIDIYNLFAFISATLNSPTSYLHDH